MGAVLAVAAAVLLLIISLWPASEPVRDFELARPGDGTNSENRSVLDVWNELADGDAMTQGLLQEGIDENEAVVEADDIPDWLLHAVAGTVAPEEEASPGPAPDDAPPADEIDEAT
jgi:hypothetical protein